MKHIFHAFDEIKNILERHDILLFLDYDGTLVPIAQTPDLAVLSQENKSLLEELAKLSSFQLVIISGRVLEDVKKKVGVDNIIYIGNHGFEIENLNGSCENPIDSEDFYKVFEELNRKLEENFMVVEGVLVEHKKWSISVHYRLLEDKELAAFSSIFEQICKPYLLKNKIAIHTGKKVFEIRPVTDWDKGKAVLWIIEKQRLAGKGTKIFPVYVGDDQTDEDAFHELRKQGITVVVGNDKKSAAKYFVSDTKEVTQFLRQLLEIK